MPIPKLTTFCCGCDLQLGCKIIGVIQAVTWLTTAAGLVHMFYLGWHGIYSTIVKYTQLEIFEVTVSCIFGIFGILLVVAAHWKIRCLLLTWMIGSIIWMIGFMAFTIYMLNSDFHQWHYQQAIIDNVSACLLEGLGIYSLFIVYSFRESLRETPNNPETAETAVNQNAEQNTIINEYEVC